MKLAVLNTSLEIITYCQVYSCNHIATNVICEGDKEPLSVCDYHYREFTQQSKETYQMNCPNCSATLLYS